MDVVQHRRLSHRHPRPGLQGAGHAARFVIPLPRPQHGIVEVAEITGEGEVVAERREGAIVELLAGKLLAQQQRAQPRQPPHAHRPEVVALEVQHEAVPRRRRDVTELRHPVLLEHVGADLVVPGGVDKVRGDPAHDPGPRAAVVPIVPAAAAEVGRGGAAVPGQAGGGGLQRAPLGVESREVVEGGRERHVVAERAARGREYSMIDIVV
mmetsp:Transcript_41833/g.112052  ORF Transcript_41833/g.112052 Transcript_41833/m.112052 type:complete len:210 (-) Transcript_41833:579-1208(-)